MIDKLSNPKTERYFELKNLILRDTKFKWIWYGNTTPELNEDGYDNFGFYLHPFLTRPTPLAKCYSEPSSDYILYANNVVAEIMDFNGIDPKVFYRICANCVHPTETGNYSVPHVDHEFPHKNFLIYLTDPQDGDTVVDGEKYLGEEDDVIIFEGKHYHRPPSKGRRIVLIATYHD